MIIVGVVLALAMAVAVAGCGKKVQPAMGSGSVVGLVRSEANREAAGILTQSLEKDRYFLPRPEKPFEVTPITIEGLEDHEYDKNVIILCDVSEGGGILKEVRRILNDQERRRLGGGESVVAFKRDVWGTYQNVVVVAAPTRAGLLSAVREGGPDIADRLEKEVVDAIERFFSEQSEIPGLRSRIVDRYGWSLRLPEGYVLKDERTDVPLMRFERPAPPRDIYVYWFSGAGAEDVESAVALRKKIAWEQYDEDEIAEGKVRGRTVEIAGCRAIRLEGLWQNTKYTIGGPFITYVVWGPECNRTLMLDLVLYAPGIEQTAYLREMEAIALTVVCCAR